MTSHNYRLQELFTAAVEIPAGDREEWLRKQCDGDEALLNDLRNLIAEDEKSHDPLEDGIKQVLGTTDEIGDRLAPIREYAAPKKPGQSSESEIRTDEFCDQLSKIEILCGDKLTAWLESLQPSRIRQDPQVLAKRLIAEGKLTKFQAAVLMEGNGQRLLIDKYLILDLIDSGGMGIVFKAVHRPMNRIVALKTLPPSRFSSRAAVKRFRREVRVAATLQHPNIVTAFDADESKGVHFLVMEYARGRDLFKRVTKGGPLSVDQAVGCVMQAASGLKHAHEHGVIHRDIKPSNLILANRRTVKVLDLGLATLGKVNDKETEHDPESQVSDDQLTQHGTLLGTVAYMAPEQASNSKRVDSRSDIYSLGCTLYFLLTGETPYGNDRIETLERHRIAAIPSLRVKRPDVPESVDAVFQRMLGKDPNDRQASMAELIKELKACKLEQVAGDSSAEPENQGITPSPPPVEAVPSVKGGKPEYDGLSPFDEEPEEEFEAADFAKVFAFADHAQKKDVDTTASVVPRRTITFGILAGVIACLALGYHHVAVRFGNSNQQLSQQDPKNAAPSDLPNAFRDYPPLEPTEPLAEFEVVDRVPDSVTSARPSETIDVDVWRHNDLLTIDRDFLIQMPSAVFSGRRQGAMRKALLAIYGGTVETEETVARGLDWLKRNQRRNGSWSMLGPYRDGALAENDCAATAMALIAFLGDGHTHQKGEYKEAVEKGIKFLISKQDRNGFMARNARAHEKVYGQAQATIAICELYAMTKDSWLRRQAQLALDFAQQSQSPEGGWRYEPNFDYDTSVTGWFVSALQAGRAADLEVDSAVLDKASSYLDTVSSSEDSAYAYRADKKSPSPAMTAVGLRCRQDLGWERSHPSLRRGIDALLLDAPFSMSDRDVYYWYYATQVLYHYGGDPWQEWNNKMRVELPASQVKAGREAGSWPPQSDRWGRDAGRLYTTCLSLLCLETYYRHLPLYAADEKGSGWRP